MIPTGLPRNDELYHVTPNEIGSLKDKLGLPRDKKIILYAPTWRESTDNGRLVLSNHLLIQRNGKQS